MAQRRNYTESEMMRMQQDAVARVQEMQNRSRLVVDEHESKSNMHNYSNTKNWSTNPNMKRESETKAQNQDEQVREHKPAQESKHTPEDPPPLPEAEKESTTIIQDILGAVGIDDDRLMIIGLMFLLINAKADNTLILALAYLLI